MKRRRSITRLGCGLLCTITATLYADERGLTPVLIGDPLDLDTGEITNVGGLSAAYNSSDNEYRVFWFDSRIPGQNDVYAQRVSPDAQLLGDNVTIIAEPTSKTDTAVAYDPGNNRYFATWRYQSDGPGSPGFNHAFGGLVSATGGLLQDPFDVSNGGLEATLVFNTIASEYFLEARNFAGGGVPGIRGQRISSDGNLVGGGISISSSGAPAGQVAYNANANQYLATWRDQSAENLKGRIINADGTFATGAFVITSMFPESGLAASLAFDPINDRYLVVFSEFCAGSVYGQFVSGSGDLEGETFTIFESTSRLSPFVARDDLNGVFLVAWTDSDSGNLDIQLLGADGALLGDPLLVIDSASGGPRVAGNSIEGGFIVAWRDRSNWPDRADIFAQLVGVVGGPCVGDLDGDGDTDHSDLGILLADWGCTFDCVGDLDGDDDTDHSDLGILLADWGCGT